MSMPWIIIDTPMTSSISTKGHTFCHLHLMSKLNLGSKISLSNDSGNRCMADASNCGNACSIEYSSNNFADVICWTPSLRKKANKITSILCEDTFICKMMNRFLLNHLCLCFLNSMIFNLCGSVIWFTKLGNFFLSILQPGVWGYKFGFYSLCLVFICFQKFLNDMSWILQPFWWYSISFREQSEMSLSHSLSSDVYSVVAPNAIDDKCHYFWLLMSIS